MVANIGRAPPYAPGMANHVDQEILIRRQRNAITNELRQLEDDLALIVQRARMQRPLGMNASPPDVMTPRIQEWLRLFREVVAVTPQPQNEYDAFKVRLHQLLVEPIYGSSLDNNCLLGSDGQTYTEIALAVFNHSARVERQRRSPVDEENPELLTTTPHECARYMVLWLEARNHNTPNSNDASIDVQRMFNALRARAQRPQPPPVDQAERIRQILEQQAERERQRNERIRRAADHIQQQEEERNRQEMRRRMAPLEQQMRDAAERHAQQARQVNEDINQELNELDRNIDELDEQVRDLRQQEGDLERQNDRAQQGLQDLRNIHQQLALEVSQLEKQILANEKACKKARRKALIIAGLCAVGTLGAQYAMAAGGPSGATGGFIPDQGGGVLFKMKIPI